MGLHLLINASGALAYARQDPECLILQYLVLDWTPAKAKVSSS